MEGNEYDIFSELEHEMGRDLTQWRRRIVASFEKSCLAAMEIEEANADAVDTSNPAVYQSIKNHTISFLTPDWIEDKDSPRPGDHIEATGESYCYANYTSDGKTMPFRLPIGYRLHGTLRYLDVSPYINEAGLELRVHTDPELAYRYTHPFGLHLVLALPTITTDAGRLLPRRPEQIYLPLHYARTGLKVYPDPQ